DAVLIPVDLAEGRRQEPLQEHQIAAAAEAVEIGRHVLAQQIASMSDPDILRRLLADRRQDLLNNRWLRRGGAVGFQPVIATLPEGANLQASAVISADRRYVRITATPIFSGIAEVNVFNMQTGQNAQGRGGTGGQGFGGMSGGGTGSPVGGGFSGSRGRGA